MIDICPRCGGKEIGCEVCHLPPKRKLSQQQTKVMAAFFNILLPYKVAMLAQVWPVQGVDLSSWNGIMNLSVTKSKAQYGYIRAGYGEGYKDYRSDTYRRDANDIDWPHGLYWFCYPQYSWERHAIGFAEVAARFPYQLELVLDAETTTLGPQATLDWFINLDIRVHQLTGKRPIIYTAKYFWDERVARSNYFSNRMNWIANYTTNPAPLLPLDLPNWGHWQHSADGNRKAVEYGMISDGDVDMDLDRSHRNITEFNAYYGTHIEPISGPKEIVPTKYVYVNTTGLNLRSLPDQFSKDIGTVKLNDDLPVLEEYNGWYRVEGWIAKSLTRPK